MLLVGCVVLLLSALRCTSSPIKNCSESEGPCWCQNERIFLKLHCVDVNNEIILQDIYSEISVEDDQAEELQPEMFSGICVTRLSLQLSELKRINDSTFDELKECVKMLLLLNGKLSNVPINALKNLHSLRFLSLAGNEIRSIPSMQSFPLHHLILTRNAISTLPKDTFPTTLKTLSVGYNHLKTLNESLLHLKDVYWLFISNNWLSSLSGELTGMKSLEMLVASNNNIKDINEAFTNLKNLKNLNLAHNLIRKLRNSLHNLNLRILNLSYNLIRKLSGKEFVHLLHLEYLDLSHNRLESVGDAFKYTRNLETLNLSANNLHVLTSNVHCSKQLVNLNLSKNYLTDLDWLIESEDDYDNDKDSHIICERHITIRQLFISENPIQCLPNTMEKINTTISQYKIKIYGLPSC